jgi:hypothetical protein
MQDPEIIDVTPQPEAPRISRLPLIWSLVKGMIFATAPAALLLWCSAGLVQLAMAGQMLAWLPLLLLAPFTLSLTLIAIPINLLLLLSLIAALSGKSHVAMKFSTQANGLRPIKRVYSKGTQLSE